MEITDKYDNVLLGILQSEGKIEKFINAIFCFLCNRTDFFLPLDASGRLGFPDGAAEAMLVRSFRHYQRVAAEMQRLKAADAAGMVASKGTATQERPKPSEDDSQQVSAPQPSSEVTIENELPKQSPQKPPVEATKSSQHTKPDEDTTCHQPEVPYTWTQTIGDIDARIALPVHVRSAKQLRVKIDRLAVKVEHVSADVAGAWTTVVDGQLPWEIRPDESVWTLNDNVVQLTLEKRQERWWQQLLADGPVTPLDQIDASRPMSDLSDEARAAIAKAQFDDRQRKLGLPTSDEQKMQDTLREAWNRDDSPFKGQPFDPAMLTSSGGFPAQTD